MKNGLHTSNQVSSIWFGDNDKYLDNLKYKYDEKGNITEVYENGILQVRYKYDSLSRIIREDNKPLNKTVTWEYDAGGNIVNRFEYEFTTVNDLSEKAPTIIPYSYATSGVRDRLMEYNGEQFEYDEIGNPTIYRNNVLVWEKGRQLKSFGNIANYTYNASGVRIGKTVGSTTTQYYLDGTRVLAQKDIVSASESTTTETFMQFMYGVDGIIGFTLNDTDYYYKKNLQGDIIGIYNNNLQLIAKYTYDAWGNHKISYLENGVFVDFIPTNSYNEGNTSLYVALKNPFRYRSYYYDTETGLYYLNSRYYDPETGRFINVDDIDVISDYKDILNGLNLFMYCNDNPVMLTDESGRGIWDWILGFLTVVAVVAMAVLTSVAIIAVAPAIASFMGSLVGSIGLASMAGGVASAISIGATMLAGTTLLIGINEAINITTGFNPLGSIVGEKAYNIIRDTIGIIGYSFISFGSMLSYPSTGNSTPNNLKEKLAMQAVVKNPNKGKAILSLKDSRMPGYLGWQKYASKVEFSSGLFYEIHYIGNKWLKWFGIWFDFKFK